MSFKIGVIFVDFNKAFNTIDHIALEPKISAAGNSCDFQLWLISYPTKRYQYVGKPGGKSSFLKN